MQEINFIGRVAYYRHFDSRKMKESEVTSSITLTNLEGREKTFLKMANGDEKEASDCYFDLSSESKSF